MRVTTVFSPTAAMRSRKSKIASIVLAALMVAPWQAAASTQTMSAPSGFTTKEIRTASLPRTEKVGKAIFGEVFQPVKTKKAKEIVKPCKDRLAVTLKEVGFKGSNLREAWAISMRESHGRPRAISATNDYGLFQFNKAAHSGSEWWSEKRLLKAEYNAKIAYKMSRGGKTWYPWGLDGRGKVKADIYRSIGWSNEKIKSHIEAPFKKYLKQFRALPEACKGK